MSALKAEVPRAEEITLRPDGVRKVHDETVAVMRQVRPPLFPWPGCVVFRQMDLPIIKRVAARYPAWR